MVYIFFFYQNSNHLPEMFSWWMSAWSRRPAGHSYIDYLYCRHITVLVFYVIFYFVVVNVG